MGGLRTGNYKVYFRGKAWGYANTWYTGKADFNSADFIPVTAPNTTTGIDAVLANAENIIYVSTDGLCGGKAPCYSSIQAGINATGEGGQLKVAQGIYHENVVVNTSKEFTLEGDPEELSCRGTE